MSELDMPLELAEDIVRELTDERYINRKHGTKSCLNAGCKGPLCAKFNRDRSREIYQKKNEEAKRQRNGSRSPDLDSTLEAIFDKIA